MQAHRGHIKHSNIQCNKDEDNKPFIKTANLLNLMAISIKTQLTMVLHRLDIFKREAIHWQTVRISKENT